MKDFTLKFNLLDVKSKKVVMDFIDFLLTKKGQPGKEGSDYKNKILSVSTWTKDDIDEIIENQTHFGKWNIPEW